MKSVAKKIIVITIMIGMIFLISGDVFAKADKKARKAYEAGNYELAVKILIEKLRKKPKHQDNIKYMETCLGLAIKKRMQSATDCEFNNDWDCAFNEYMVIKQSADAVSMMPPVIKKHKKDKKKGIKKHEEEYHYTVPNVMEQIKVCKENAIIAHYDKGLEHEGAGRFKQAAIEFRLVKGYNPGYQDAAQRYRDDREKAMVKVAIMPFENLSGKTKYGAVDYQLTEKIVSNALNMNPEFVQFYTRENLSSLLAEQGLQQSDIVDQSTATELGKKVGVQAFVFGKILNIVEDFPQEKVVNGTSNASYYKDKREIPISCRWWKHTRKGSISISASIKIIDVKSGQIMSAQEAKGIASDEKRWVMFKGDERALSSDVLSHRNCEGDTPIASNETLCQQALERISGDLASKIYAHFK